MQICIFKCAESESELRIHVRIRFPMEQLIRTISGCMCNDFFPKCVFFFKIKNVNKFPLFSLIFLEFFTIKYSRNDCDFFEKIDFFDFSACMQNPIFPKLNISLNLKNSALFRIIFIDFLSNFLQRDIWKMISNFWENCFFYFSVRMQSQLPI